MSKEYVLLKFNDYARDLVLDAIVKKLTTTTNREYMLLVKSEQEKTWFEDQLMRRLDGIWTSIVRITDRQRKFNTMMGTTLRIILPGTLEEFERDTCGVSIDKWWGTFDGGTFPERIRPRLNCCLMGARECSSQ